jgi:hypothetical protein
MQLTTICGLPLTMTARSVDKGQHTENTRMFAPVCCKETYMTVPVVHIVICITSDTEYTVS